MEYTRDTIFISHSTPQDNVFSIWLASRLEMLGYKVWVDKNGLIGGERFWNTIQHAIDQSIKVLFVYSKNIVTADGSLKGGIEKELSYAENVAYENGLKDYIIPLHIDDSKFHLAIGLPNLNHIPFSDNWAEGLKQLLRKLEKDGVPKSSESLTSSFSEWYENDYISSVKIIEKKRLYYSSILQVKRQPQEFCLYRFATKDLAILVRNANPGLPINLSSNVLATFERHLNLSIETPSGEHIEIEPKDKYYCAIRDLNCPEFFTNEFPTYLDTINAYRRLMKSVWNSLLRKTGHSVYILSGKRHAYYKEKKGDKIPKIVIKYPFSNRTKKKSIYGKYRDYFWHYGLSATVETTPTIGYNLKSHIIFTEDGVNIISDTRKQHSFRRDKGKRFFNEEWRDLFLAFIFQMRSSDGKISIKVTYDDQIVELSSMPLLLWSEVDYNDPNTKMDIDSVADYNVNDSTDDEI